jgi:hypothetical protein
MARTSQGLNLLRGYHQDLREIFHEERCTLQDAPGLKGCDQANQYAIHRAYEVVLNYFRFLSIVS